MSKPQVKSMTVDYYSDKSLNMAWRAYKGSKKWRSINLISHRKYGFPSPGYGQPLYTIELER